MTNVDIKGNNSLKKSYLTLKRDDHPWLNPLRLRAKLFYINNGIY